MSPYDLKYVYIMGKNGTARMNQLSYFLHQLSLTMKLLHILAMKMKLHYIAFYVHTIFIYFRIIYYT